MNLSAVTGRCIVFFFLAVVLDLVGIILLLVGIFAGLEAFDFYIYTGTLIIGFSLVFWMLWYTGNVEVTYKELGLDF